MALPNDYAGQACSLARALEVVGERWTLLILRDAFYGVRRFGDFATHLSIPRAVLTERLKSLVAAEVLVRVASGPRGEYELTAKGVSLWPAVRMLAAWGEEHYADDGPMRIFRHVDDEGLVDPTGRCEACGGLVDVADTIITPGSGLHPTANDDPVAVALRSPHRLLQPVHT
jgi:DNA-binding HxlR family transcriptional regulator